MKKIYAVQMDGEQFNPEWHYGELEAVGDQVFLGGNREFITINEDLEKDVRKALENCQSDLESLDYHDEYTEEEKAEEKLDTLKYYFSGLAASTVVLNEKELETLAKLAEDFSKVYKYEDELEIICQALSILNNKTFVWGILHGSSQGDWIYYICPKSKQDFVNTYVEAVYFGTGTEFEVAILDTDELEDEDNVDAITDKIYEADHWFDYTHLWKEDDVKEYLANQNSYGDDKFTKDDVELILIENSYTVVKYKYKKA